MAYIVLAVAALGLAGGMLLWLATLARMPVGAYAGGFLMGGLGLIYCLGLVFGALSLFVTAEICTGLRRFFLDQPKAMDALHDIRDRLPTT